MLLYDLYDCVIVRVKRSFSRGKGKEGACCEKLFPYLLNQIPGVYTDPQLNGKLATHDDLWLTGVALVGTALGQVLCASAVWSSYQITIACSDTPWQSVSCHTHCTSAASCH